MLKAIDRALLPKRITDARKQKGLNQAELAEKVGVTPAAISQIEKGTRVPTIPVISGIAKALGVSLDYLIGKSEKSQLEDLLQQEEVQVFFRGFQTLDPQDQETIKKHIEFLKSRLQEGQCTPQAAVKLEEAVNPKKIVKKPCHKHPDREKLKNFNGCFECKLDYQREWHIKNTKLSKQGNVRHSVVKQSKVERHAPDHSASLGKQIGGGMPIVEFCHKNGIGYMEGCVIKYVSRWRRKGGVEDLEKAIHYLEMLVEMETRLTTESTTAIPEVERLPGFEPGTLGLEVGCSKPGESDD